MADHELLALLLRTGYQGCNVLELAQQVLQNSGGYTGLLQADPEKLKAIKGLGPAIRAELLAVMEMARRALSQPMRSADVFDTPGRVKDYLALHLAGREREVFVVMFLNTQHHMLALEEMFHGTLMHTSVYPREVVRRALALNAAAVVLAHNHPSGVAEPSRADESLTLQLVRALQLVDVRVLDHVVVGQGQVVSMTERGLM